MLFKLVYQTCRRIEALDVERDFLTMLSEVERARPEVIEELRKIPVVGPIVVEGNAKMLVQIVLGGADMARQLARELKKNGLDVGAQLALATILAYFVQPNDLIPDDAPGGYGFLDDVLLLRVGAYESLDALFPDQNQEFANQLLANSLPESVIPTLGDIMTKLQQAIQSIGAMGPVLLPRMVQAIIANPLASSMPTAPGFQPRPGRINLNGPDGLRVPAKTFAAGGALMVGDKVMSMDPSHKPGSWKIE